jgi:hypothetical protein
VTSKESGLGFELVWVLRAGCPVDDPVDDEE